MSYKVWIDVYDLINCDELLGKSELYVMACVGHHEAQKAKYARKSSKRWTWKPDPRIQEISVDMPIDVDQIPDIIIYIYASSTWRKDEKIAFCRVKAANHMNLEP